MPQDKFVDLTERQRGRSVGDRVDRLRERIARLKPSISSAEQRATLDIMLGMLDLLADEL